MMDRPDGYERVRSLNRLDQLLTTEVLFLHRGAIIPTAALKEIIVDRLREAIHKGTLFADLDTIPVDLGGKRKRVQVPDVKTPQTAKSSLHINNDSFMEQSRLRGERRSL